VEDRRPGDVKITILRRYEDQADDEQRVVTRFTEG
jgi:hypothetical protein